MTNPSLQEEWMKYVLHTYNQKWINPMSAGEAIDVADYWLKVIAERDEALRQSFREIDRYYTNPKGKVMVYVDDVSSLLSKE